MFTWASGNTYKGEYKEDERDGYGEMRWTDGSIYLGEWSRGIQHGQGKMMFPNGIVKEGLFEMNVYKGPRNSNAEGGSSPSNAMNSIPSTENIR
jgi:hypothetical protein